VRGAFVARQRTRQVRRGKLTGQGAGPVWRGEVAGQRVRPVQGMVIAGR
jgi:hypothetical protein